MITEFVNFTVLDTSTDTQLITKADFLNAFLKNLDGYIDAELVKDIEGNTWRIIYHFSNIEKVKAIGEKMRNSKEFEEFNSLLLPGSISVNFFHHLGKW